LPLGRRREEEKEYFRTKLSGKSHCEADQVSSAGVLPVGARQGVAALFKLAMIMMMRDKQIPLYQ